MGIDPDIFGPFLWASIHLICLGAPDKLNGTQQEMYKAFFQNLPNIIPCESCGENMKKNLNRLPLENSVALMGSKELFKWSIDLHNLVNKELGKPEIKYEDALKIWKSQKPLNTNNNNGKKYFKLDQEKSNTTNYLLIFISFISGILLSLIIMYIYMRK